MVEINKVRPAEKRQAVCRGVKHINGKIEKVFVIELNGLEMTKKKGKLNRE